MIHIIIFWVLTSLHPYHVSVADIVYNEEANALQISYRMFLDDLELALREESGNKNLNIIKDSLLVHQANQDNFRKKFKVTINGIPVEYDYLGGEIEDDGLWTYLEVTGIKNAPKIELMNKLLLDIYDDQQNIIHFKIAGDKKSFIINNSNTHVLYEP